MKYLFLMAAVSASATVARNVARSYWAVSDRTHGDTSDEFFESYYAKITDVVKPQRDDTLLDAGCGAGQLTHLFHKNGFRIRGFDSSSYLVSCARRRFGNDLFYVDDVTAMRRKAERYAKVLLTQVFFYVHPACYPIVLKNLLDIASADGRVYLLDDPDYSKRHMWYNDPHMKEKYRNLLDILSYFFPVYAPHMGGFWVKTRHLEKVASQVGFSRVERLDSWASYRSHHILFVR